MRGKNTRHTSLASEDLLRKHGGKTGQELKAAGYLSPLIALAQPKDAKQKVLIFGKTTPSEGKIKDQYLV